MFFNHIKYFFESFIRILVSPNLADDDLDLACGNDDLACGDDDLACCIQYSSL